MNLGGQTPGKDVPIRASNMSTGVDTALSYFPRIRKLEIRGYNQHCVVIYSTLGAVVEDNYLHHAHAGVYGAPSMDVTIRRNTVTHAQQVAMALGGNRGGVVESNVIRDYNVNPFQTRNYAGGIMCNGIIGTALRFNVVTHAISPAAGMWPDCSGLGNAWYGNVLYRIKNCGFYIEAGAVGNVLRWNHCFEDWGGIVLRQNYMNVAAENYVHDNTGVGMAVSTPDGDNNIANYFGDNVIANNPTGIGTGASADKTIANSFDRNTYVLAKDGRVMQFDNKQLKSVKEVRSMLGEETHGKVVDKFDPASLGLVSFRVFGTEKDWEPVQMYGNPGMERFDVLESFSAPYFWGRGTFRESSPFGWTCTSVSDNGLPVTIPGTDGFLRHLDPRNLTFVRNYPGGKVGGGNIEDAKAHGGNYLFQVGAVPGKRISDRGLGFWSPALCTVPGAKVDVSLWMERSGIVPADPDRLGGVYVFVEWTNITGQNASRSYIVGGEKPGQAEQIELASGTGPYTNVKGTVTAPAGAVWMRLAYGMRSASGWASFDDVDLQTRPGRSAAQSAAAVPLDATRFDWQSIDLAGVVNRDLVNQDPAAGWTRTAVTVHTSKYPNVSLYGTIWRNPHPGTEIKSIKMTAAGTGVPLLVAISIGLPRASAK